MELVRWNEFTAYFLGYMVGDGSIGVYRDFGNHIKKPIVSIDSTDKEVISKFAEILEKKLNGHWYTTESGEKNFIYTIDFVDDDIYNFLQQEGVVNRKSYVGCELTLNYGGYENHFIRGLFDSDGSVGIYSNKIKSYVGGHESYIGKIRDLLGFGNLYKGDGIIKLAFDSVSDNIKFRDFIYRDSTIFLSRKREIFYSSFNKKGRSRDGEGKAEIWKLYDSLYDRRNEIVDLRDNGMSFQKLGDKFNCHKSQMRLLYQKFAELVNSGQ